ncbi:aldehyde dehydrogenase family protein [Streptomyces sp. NRRL WC-3742]|uniref:aldehyde dehydrogenase family protein n=1 Tax=Streptomyces sp. NRRL WC-3742 TaxID=1463934 RepID=UPI0005628B13|nr:aldehyde dehydrogenase family protein [Streptomyces sp. NRRL WC-3742]
MRYSYPVLLGGEPRPGDGWYHWPHATAQLRETYDVMKLKAQLDFGRAPEGAAEDPRLAGRVARSTPEQAKAALALAREAQPAWARVPLARRLAFAEAVHRELLARAEEFTEVLVAEGHPLTVARWELASMLSATHPQSLRHARQALHWEGEQSGRRIRLVRKPDGVVGLNPALNAAALTSLFGVMVLAAGNALVVNAPSAAPLGVAFLYQEIIAPLLAEFGAPPGLLSMLASPTRPLLTSWLESADCDDVFWFGSADNGAKVAKSCLENGKKPILELSGNDALVVWRDADLPQAARAAAERYHASGQLCLSPKFTLVHPAVAQEFTELLLRQVAALRIGPPGDPEVLLSPVVKRAQCLDVMADAVEQGAQLLCGGTLVDVDDVANPRGPFVRPVLLRVHGLTQARRMRAVREETFFPLMCVVVPEPAPDEDLLEKLIAFVNDNRYGLRNSLWARDPRVIERFADEVVNGGLLRVNDSHIGPLPVLPLIGGTGLTGGVFGEGNLAYLRTTRLQGISQALDPSGPEIFDHLAAATAP